MVFCQPEQAGYRFIYSVLFFIHELFCFFRLCPIPKKKAICFVGTGIKEYYSGLKDLSEENKE
jgi:hypothetical protein